VRSAEDSLGPRSRVLLRYSGTELLARVMVEGEDAQRVQSTAQEIAEAIRVAIG
jgi:phosphoglucosamine mutase